MIDSVTMVIKGQYITCFDMKAPNFLNYHLPKKLQNSKEQKISLSLKQKVLNDNFQTYNIGIGVKRKQRRHD